MLMLMLMLLLLLRGRVKMGSNHRILLAERRRLLVGGCWGRIWEDGRSGRRDE
jgi:hypothetical protein